MAAATQPMRSQRQVARHLQHCTRQNSCSDHQGITNDTRWGARRDLRGTTTRGEREHRKRPGREESEAKDDACETCTDEAVQTRAGTAEGADALGHGPNGAPKQREPERNKS